MSIATPVKPEAPIRDEFLDKVLNKVNQLRAQVHLSPIDELPLGTVRNADSCVLARALDANVHCDFIAFNGDGPVMGTPRLLQRFIKSFDFGVYPHLEA